MAQPVHEDGRAGRADQQAKSSPLSAAERWREALEAWAIPQPILDSAPESPWGFDVGQFDRRAEAALGRVTVSNERALEALPEAGVVLDVGCGAGAASLPLARKARRLVGVDATPGMLAMFGHRARAAGAAFTAVEGRWPDVAAVTPMADVAVCHHVAYNAPDLATFAARLTDHARQRVVLELTDAHPMSRLNTLWLTFHHVFRPTTPTADDAVAVLQELGLAPQRQDWTEQQGSEVLSFASRSDAVAWVRRRLCLGAERDPEIERAFESEGRLAERGGTFGLPPMPLVTLWWRGSGS